MPMYAPFEKDIHSKTKFVHAMMHSPPLPPPLWLMGGCTSTSLAATTQSPPDPPPDSLTGTSVSSLAKNAMEMAVKESI